MVQKYHIANHINSTTPMAAFADLNNGKDKTLFTFSQDIFRTPPSLG